MEDDSQDAEGMEDARCESGIWRMTVRVLWSEDAGCESGYLDDDSQGAEGRGFWM